MGRVTSPGYSIGLDLDPDRVAGCGMGGAVWTEVQPYDDERGARKLMTV